MSIDNKTPSEDSQFERYIGKLSGSFVALGFDPSKTNELAVVVIRELLNKGLMPELKHVRGLFYRVQWADTDPPACQTVALGLMNLAGVETAQDGTPFVTTLPQGDNLMPALETALAAPSASGIATDEGLSRPLEAQLGAELAAKTI